MLPTRQSENLKSSRRTEDTPRIVEPPTNRIRLRIPGGGNSEESSDVRFIARRTHIDNNGMAIVAGDDKRNVVETSSISGNVMPVDGINGVENNDQTDEKSTALYCDGQMLD